jgi:hypothetical protein
MTEATQVKGRLVSIAWANSASDATLSIDVTKPQEAKAEIEDELGITHIVSVHLRWDADYLVGKDVTAKTTDDGMTLVEL